VAVEAICEKQTKVPKDECEAGLSKIWELVAEKECTTVCENDPAYKDPVYKADCALWVEDWDGDGFGDCALQQDWSGFALMTAETMEEIRAACPVSCGTCPKTVAYSALPDVACDFLKDQDKEKVAVEAICEKQTKVPKDECEAGLSKIWEMVAEKECPNASHVDSLFV
jgi:hypothetical protein